MAMSLQPTTWKTGSKFISHLFQAITHTSDLIESEQVALCLQVKPKGSHLFINRKLATAHFFSRQSHHVPSHDQ